MLKNFEFEIVKIRIYGEPRRNFTTVEIVQSSIRGFLIELKGESTKFYANAPWSGCSKKQLLVRFSCTKTKSNHSNFDLALTPNVVLNITEQFSLFYFAIFIISITLSIRRIGLV